MMDGLDETIEALMYKKTCELCGESFECIKPHGKYCSASCKSRAFRKKDPEKYRRKAREHIAKNRSNNPEKYRQYMQQWKRNNKEKVRSYRRKEKEKIGKVYKTKEEIKKHALQLELEQKSYREARQAWEYWMKQKAPMGWIARYYKSMGKPWLNHRLSNAVRYRIKYRMDEVFRQKEIHRAGARREFIRTVDDETHDYRSLLMERKTCPYCGKRLNQKNRVIDHMDAVANGSSHSMSNMIVCCRDCNHAKRDKNFSDWVSTLKKQFKIRSLAVYKRKRGSFPEQGKLDLFFN